jgi:hypothetical protein
MNVFDVVFDFLEGIKKITSKLTSLSFSFQVDEHEYEKIKHIILESTEQKGLLIKKSLHHTNAHERHVVYYVSFSTTIRITFTIALDDPTKKIKGVKR